MGLTTGRNRGNAGNAENAGNARETGASTVIAASITGLASDGRASRDGVTIVLAADRCDPAAMKSPGSRGGNPPGKPSLRFRVPESLKPGQPLLASYRDPSGNTPLEGREIPGVRVVPGRPGADRPVAFQIVNKTPEIISIGGQAEQVLTSSGGSPNRLVQKVDSVAPGNFNIDFSLAADRCPCQTKAP